VKEEGRIPTVPRHYKGWLVRIDYPTLVQQVNGCLWVLRNTRLFPKRCICTTSPGKRRGVLRRLDACNKMTRTISFGPLEAGSQSSFKERSLILPSMGRGFGQVQDAREALGFGTKRKER